ncbi:MAG: chemotaxis protein CheX [Pseudomonadota bacterium]
MESNWSRALKASISDAFSTMYFMVPEWDPEVLAEAGAQKAESWLEGRVEMNRERFRLSIWLWCPPGVARELAANLLALDSPDVGEEQMMDAFRELLNMVAGGLLTAVDVQGQWRMGLPEARVCDKGQVKDLLKQAKEQFGFYVDERPVLAGLGPLTQ